jgi:hypothetical protein
MCQISKYLRIILLNARFYVLQYVEGIWLGSSNRNDGSKKPPEPSPTTPSTPFRQTIQ